MGDAGMCAKCGARQVFLFQAMTSCPTCDNPRQQLDSACITYEGRQVDFLWRARKYMAVLHSVPPGNESQTWALDQSVTDDRDDNLEALLEDPWLFANRWWFGDKPGRPSCDNPRQGLWFLWFYPVSP
jgi:hypothetical protein